MDSSNKIITRLAFCALMLLLRAYLTPRTATAQTIERSFDVSSGERLDLNLETGGTISIKGWNRNEVGVTVERRGRDADMVDVNFQERSWGLSVRTDYNGRRRNHNASIHMEINVPSRFDIDIETTGGDLNISGIEGEIEGRTMGGDLLLSELKGTVDLTTMGGTIELTDSEVDGKVHTMGGEVLIEDVIGNIKGTTMGGEVTYRNVKTGGANNEEVRIQTMGGDINVEEAEAGANVNTMGGDIRIRAASDHVEATTMGGNIDVDAIDGWIEATTMGGDVDVTMVGDPDSGDRHVELTSMGGDIELVVPAGLSMEIDLELSFTRDSRENYRIISDFDIDIERTTDWEYSGRDARKYIYGTGTVGGGEHLIRIKTVNGNITLRRR